MTATAYPTPESEAVVLAQSFPLDARLYSLKDEELEFMKSETGISDEEELKDHILRVQAEAYSVYPYPCIRRFGFIHFKLFRLPGYDRLLSLGRQCKNGILLDVGCCFGDDVRKAAADGFPAERIVASDLHAEYWELGHKLFRTTNETFPASFMSGNVFDPTHLEVLPPPKTYDPESGSPPDLSELSSLNPLRGHVIAIHASSFFHLFDEEKQEHIARAFAGLLSPMPGSMILGMQGGVGHINPMVKTHGEKGGTFTMYCQTPERWTKMWERVFPKDTVRVEARIGPERVGLGETKYEFLQWCVTRL
ncbi:hypothetical protein GY45DRAFT_592101 [Cubamyces sp. BRFM 1775]|nr:hypothetical protein GY45DRAFT_592101 [Cubamyces sp. BRFM 1775]